MPRHRRSSARGSVPERSLSDPILLELVKNALDTIVDEMAIALVRTAYSNNLKNAMDMSCALCDAEGRLIAQGLTLPLHLGSIPDAMAQMREEVRRPHRPRRRLHPERPLRGRHAPAGLLHLQADLPRQGAGGLGREHRPSARRGRQDPGRQWLRRHRDLPGGAAHSRRQALRAGRACRAGLRDDRPQCARAAPGAGRRALPGGRVLHRRARLSEADGPARRRALQRLHDHAARPGRAARAVGHREDARRHLRVHRLDRRRRHRPRPHPDHGRDHGEGRPAHRGFHRLGFRRYAGPSTRRCRSPSPPSTRRCGI